MELKKLQLKKPEKSTFKGPVVIMYDRHEYLPNGLVKTEVVEGKTRPVAQRVVLKLNYGATFDEEPQVAHEVIAKYRGLIVEVPVKLKDAPSNKMLKEEAVK